MRIVPYEEFCSQEFASAWKRLLALQTAYDIGNTYEWNRCWWESYREQGPWKKHWSLLVHENRGEVGAIFPLIIRSRFGIRIVEFLGQSGGFMTDYLGAIGAPDCRDGMARRLLEFLLTNADRWDLTSLALPAWGDELPRYMKNSSLADLAERIRRDTEIAGFSVAIRLPKDFDGYLSSLGRRTRADLRRYLRIAAKAGAELTIHRGSEVCDHVDVLCDLNSQNWGVFRDARGRRFVSEVSRRLASANEPALLAVFRVRGQPLGAVQGFETSDTCFLHTAGVSRCQADGMSPGMTMYAMLIQSLIERGVGRLDLSPGLEEYKLRLGGVPERIYKLQLTHRRSKVARWRAFNWSRDAFYWARDRTRASFRSLVDRREDGRTSRQP